MTTYLEKVASDFGNELTEEIFKVASEEIDEMQPEDVLSEYLEDLENAGYDISGLTMEDINMNGVYDYGVNKAAEYISEDIDKVAGGESINYVTAAAAKAVAPFLTNDGVANLGSAFGQGNGPIGSVVNANTDKNVFGGWGTLIGQNSVNPNAVHAEGKVNSLLGATNMKYASDEEIFLTILDKTASDFDQTVDDFITDLAIEAIEEQYEGQKVASAILGYSLEDLVVADIEKSASELETSPENFLLSFGLELAEDYVKEAVYLGKFRGDYTGDTTMARRENLISGLQQKGYAPEKIDSFMKQFAATAKVHNASDNARVTAKRQKTELATKKDIENYNNYLKTNANPNESKSSGVSNKLMYGAAGTLAAGAAAAGLYKHLQNKKKETEEKKEASEGGILEFAKAKLLGL